MAVLLRDAPVFRHRFEAEHRPIAVQSALVQEWAALLCAVVL